MADVYRPTHHLGGISDVAVGDALYNYGRFDPAKWITYFNDFFTYAAGDWTITTTEAGGGSASEALTAGSGGLLLITNDAADDDHDFFQLAVAPFRWSSTKRLFFEARFKVSDATQSDVVIGLQATDTTPLDVDDGIFFLSSDGAATATFNVEKNGTASTATGVTLADDTFTVLAFNYLPQTFGGPIFEVFQDGVRVGKVTSTTNAPDDVDINLSFGIQNGEAVAKTMTVDYLLVALER